MISPDDALKEILSTVSSAGIAEVPLTEASGCYLAKDFVAPFGLPLFDNSAMDGYAVQSLDITPSDSQEAEFEVIGCIPAGPLEPGMRALNGGEAYQILTGAPIPESADTVVRQEDVTINGNRIRISKAVNRGANIRRAGEEIQEGQRTLKAGQRLSPAAIGLLANFGLQTVEIHKKPLVTCIATGSELKEPGTDLQFGEIYNSNSVMLRSALQELNLDAAQCVRCLDDQQALVATLDEALQVSDVILFTGGVSVGQFDYVKDAVAHAGIKEVFWKVAQKPGKPFYFAADTARGKYVFGLPGNPASALVCFYEYVQPALQKLMGSAAPGPSSYLATLQSPISKSGSLTHFLKGNMTHDSSVEILGSQGSHMLSSFARANCLVVVPAEVNDLQKGEQVTVHLLTK